MVKISTLAVICFLAVLGQSQALKCWLCTNKAEDQPGCQWDSLNTQEARLQSRMPRRSDRCNACVKMRLVGPDNLNVVARGCATECQDGDTHEGPFTATSKCCTTDLCNN